MLNHILPESKDNILCVEIGEVISSSSYNEILEPAIKKILAHHDQARLLIHYSADLPGWEEKAARKDLENMAHIGPRLSKIALINAPEQTLIKWTTLKPLVSGEVRYFQ